MTTRVPDQGENLSAADLYNAAIQLYTHEVRTLGEKTTAFLLVQTILVAAFVALIPRPSDFPFAYVYIVLGVIIVGVLYCLLHYKAGRSAARAAFAWRQYIRHIERGTKLEVPFTTPWDWLYR